MKIICWLFGHDYDWYRVRIFSFLNPENRNLWKWRGICRRCEHWTTAIPAEFAMKIPDRFPALKKFVETNTRWEAADARKVE